MNDYEAKIERQELAVQLAEWMLSGCTNSATVYRWHKRAASLAQQLKRRRASLIADLRDDAEAMLWALDERS